MYRLSRSSRATGPKMRPPRVPRIRRQQDHRVVVEADVGPVGPPALLGRPHDDGARPRPSSPPPGSASFTGRPTTVSPMLAYRRADPPSTRMPGAPWLRCCPRHGSGSPAGSLGALHDLDEPPPSSWRAVASPRRAPGRPRAPRWPRRAPRASSSGARSCRRADDGTRGRSDDDGLVHPVRDHHAGPHLAAAALVRHLLVAHDSSSAGVSSTTAIALASIVRSRITVAMRDVVPELLDRRRVVELPGGELEPQVEQLLLRGLRAFEELLVRQLAQLGGLARHPSHPALVMNFVLIGSLCWARPIASRRGDSFTPASSNITRPGFHGDPALRVALARPHPGLGRLLRHRLVREDGDPPCRRGGCAA